jgi:hypothetical protein
MAEYHVYDALLNAKGHLAGRKAAAELELRKLDDIEARRQELGKLVLSLEAEIAAIEERMVPHAPPANEPVAPPVLVA